MMGSGIDLDVLLAGLKCANIRRGVDGIAFLRIREGPAAAWGLHWVMGTEIEKSRFAYGATPEDAYQRACAEVRDRLKAKADRAMSEARSAANELATMIPKVPKA